MNHFLSHKKGLANLLLICVATNAYACSKDVYFDLHEEGNTVTIEYGSPNPSKPDSLLTISTFSALGFSHQSAASFGDYAFFVTNGRSKICMYNLAKKQKNFILSLVGQNRSIFHSNQSSFGVEKYESVDHFPLLYISQGAKTDTRCFMEVYRIFPLYDEEMSDYESFYVDLVQTIYFPAMSRENSLGNVNCAIDPSGKYMYTYSRNNNLEDDNYGQCKVSKFIVPDLDSDSVVLEDTDILSSFMIDCSAISMQGGCIRDGMLFIGQGYSSAGYIYLNVIDLEKQKLIKQYDLMNDYRVRWEPEGCFVYDGTLMLAHTSAISMIEQ